MSRVYIHYGSKKFDTERFTPIKNCYPRNKPIGGLWASDVNAPFGWKKWCEGEQYHKIFADSSLILKNSWQWDMTLLIIA